MADSQLPLHTCVYRAMAVARSRPQLLAIARGERAPDTPFGFSCDAFLSREAIGELLRTKCIDRQVPLVATPLLDAHLRWRAGYAQPEGARMRNEPLVLSVRDVAQCAAVLLVVTARVDPSIEAQRAYAERFDDVPLTALVGYAHQCGSVPVRVPGTAPESSGDRRARLDARNTRLSENQRYVRNVLLRDQMGAELGAELYDQLYSTRPVSLEMLLYGGTRRPSNETTAEEAEMRRWKVAVVATRSFRLVMHLRGYVSRAFVERNCARVGAYWLLPPSALEASTSDAMAHAQQCDDVAPCALRADEVEVEEDEESSDCSSETLLLDDDDADDHPQTPPPEPTVCALPPHELDRVDKLALERLTLYECDRASRDRLSVLLSICAFTEQRDKFATMPNARHVFNYPRGPGAPVRVAHPQAPGLLASATPEDYGALGLALLCLAAHRDARLVGWLLYAEALFAQQRRSTPHEASAHIGGCVRALNECIEPSASADDNLHALVGQLRELMREQANLEAYERSHTAATEGGGGEVYECVAEASRRMIGFARGDSLRSLYE